MTIQLAPKAPPWKSEVNPLGPPADSATATPVSAGAMDDLEGRINQALSYLGQGDVYSLEDDFGLLSVGAQTALQSAVDTLLTQKNGGRLLLQNAEYDVDSIQWPVIGLDKPTPTIELVGARRPLSVGFMPGVGLTLAQGGDMPPVSGGTIIKASQASGPAFGGNLSAPSNALVVFKDLVVRCPPNPPWHAIDGGWLLNMVADGVVCDTGRSWGDGSNPLSAGPIEQPTNAAVEGVIFPGAGNGGVSVARDLLVAGFYNGLRHSEHFDGDRVTIAKCVVGMRPADGWHAARVGRMSLYWNQVGIQPVRFSAGDPVTRLQIAELDFEEDAVGGNWYTTTHHLNDPNNYLRGAVRWHRVVPNLGPASELLRRGAAYLNDHPITFDRTLVDAVGFEGADSANALPASLAGQVAVQLHGTWGVSSQRAYISAVGGGNDLAVWETGLVNPLLQARVVPPSPTSESNLGVALFAIDANNFFAVALTQSQVAMQKADAGAQPTVAGPTNLPAALVVGQEVDIQVQVVGKTIRVYVDGVQRLAYTMTAAEWTKFSASTSHGLYAWTGAGYEPGGANGGRWDSLRVKQAGAIAV